MLSCRLANPTKRVMLSLLYTNKNNWNSFENNEAFEWKAHILKKIEDKHNIITKYSWWNYYQTHLYTETVKIYSKHRKKVSFNQILFSRFEFLSCVHQKAFHDINRDPCSSTCKTIRLFNNLYPWKLLNYALCVTTYCWRECTKCIKCTQTW